MCFLDLELSLIDHINVQNIKFAVYRKPSYTGVSIHASSLHPKKQKMAIINSAIHCPVHLTLGKTAIEEETKVIERIAQINGLKLNIDRMIRQKRLRTLIAENISTQGSTSKGKEKWIRLPFLGPSSSKFTSDVRRHVYKAAFYPVNTFSRKSGIYRAKCEDCNSIYRVSQKDVTS